MTADTSTSAVGPEFSGLVVTKRKKNGKAMNVREVTLQIFDTQRGSFLALRSEYTL